MRGAKGFMRAVACGLLATLGAAGLAACGSDAGAEAPKNVVTIGVVAPIDGGLTEFGRGIARSVQLAVDQAQAANVLPGWTIKVEAVDDSSKPEVGAKNAEKLAKSPSVAAVVGTYNSGVAQAVAPELQQAGIAMVSPANTNPALTIGDDRGAPKRQFPNYFRMVATDAQQGGFLAQYALQDRQAKKVAVVTSSKPVSKGLAGDFKTAFERGGGTITSFTTVPEGATDYTEYAKTAKVGEPELLFFGGEYAEAIPMKKAAIAAGLTVPLIGGDGVQAPEYIEGVGPDSAQADIASSVGAPVPSEPNGKTFLDAYEKANFTDAPSNFGPFAYDATAAILNALIPAVQGKDRVDAQVRAAVIANLQGTKTTQVAELEMKMNPGSNAFGNGAVTGEIGFDQYGDTTNRILTVYRVQAGEWVPIVTRGFAG